jgi:uncharacterized protein YegP (UPF0339 family)
MYFTLYKDVGGYYRWTLYAANHLKVADSAEGYNNKVDAQSGINLVKSTTYATPVLDRT